MDTEDEGFDSQDDYSMEASSASGDEGEDYDFDPSQQVDPSKKVGDDLF